MSAVLSPNLHGVGPVGDAVKAPLCNGSGQDGGGGGSIARLFVGLVGHVLRTTTWLNLVPLTFHIYC